MRIPAHRTPDHVAREFTPALAPNRQRLVTYTDGLSRLVLDTGNAVDLGVWFTLAELAALRDACNAALADHDYRPGAAA